MVAPRRRLKEPLRLHEVLQPMLAEICQCNIARQAAHTMSARTMRELLRRSHRSTERPLL